MSKKTERVPQEQLLNEYLEENGLSEEDLVKNNHSIFYFMTATNSNVNGDPNNDNKPRKDNAIGKGLSSEFRFKRNIRDYMKEEKGDNILRPRDMKVAKMSEKIEKIHKDTKMSNELYKILLNYYDVRLYGMMAALKSRKKDCEIPKNFIGPMTVEQGVSLNKIQIKTQANTNTLAINNTEGEKSGNMGRKHMVRHGLYAYDSRIAANSGKITGLLNKDIVDLDEAVLFGLNYRPTSSKKGLESRLYIRVELKVSNRFLTRQATKCKLITDKPQEKIESIEDYKVNVDSIINQFIEAKDFIEKINIYHDRELDLDSKYFEDNAFVEYLKRENFPVNEIKKWDINGES